MFLAGVEFNYHSFHGNCQFACNKSITCPVGKLWYTLKGEIIAKAK